MCYVTYYPGTYFHGSLFCICSQQILGEMVSRVCPFFFSYKSPHNAYKELPSQANSLWILFVLCTYSSHSLEGRSSGDALDEGQS